MVLDTERNILAVENEFIYLSVCENICLDLIISSKTGLRVSEIERLSYPYNFYVRRVISNINKKIKKYGQIRNASGGRYRAICYPKTRRNL